MKILLKTEKSALKSYTLRKKYNKLILNCITEVNNNLTENPPIYIYNKIAYQHRSVGFFSNKSIGYYYSGKLAKSKPLTPNLEILLNMINKKLKANFNGILVNKYKDGSDYISAHSDDEKNLDDIGVVVISYGAIRKFRIRDKKTKVIQLDVPTEPNRILHMEGDFQKEFIHEIPIQKRIKEERYSFTFRKHQK